MPRIMPEPRYFSMPSTVVGAAALRNKALNWTPCVRSLIQDPLARTNSPAEIIAAWPADKGDEITLATGFDPQHAEAVVGVMEGDTVDQSRQNLRRARHGYPGHAAMMEINFRDRY